MAIYGIHTNEILGVAGNFVVIDTHNNILYVEGNDLNSPFFEAELPQEILDKKNAILKEAREKKEIELNLYCDSLLTSFSSNALGETHFYDSSPEDQLNLIALVVAGISGYFRCYKENELKQNIPHTKEQLNQVFKDGLEYKANMISICGKLKAHLLTLKSKEEIERVRWEDYESIKETNE